ncbi:MAG: hypothetical protein ACE5F6_15115 [Anaerolineae bacterium]
MGTLLATNLLTRIVLGFRVEDSDLQARLPAPWQVTSISRGAFRGVNLLVIFNDALLNQDAEGKPAPDAINRYVGFVIPATPPDAGEPANFPVRILAVHPQSIPGRYRTSIQATARRQQAVNVVGIETVVTDHFEFRDDAGGEVVLDLQYRRGTPARAKSQVNVRSAVEPAIHRIHQLDQLVDVVKSLPAGIDRVQHYRLRVTVPELGDLFDSKEQLVSIAVNPWHLRQVFEP